MCIRDRYYDRWEETWTKNFNEQVQSTKDIRTEVLTVRDSIVTWCEQTQDKVVQEAGQSYRDAINLMFESMKLLKIEILEQKKDCEKKVTGMKKEVETWLEKQTLEHKNDVDQWKFEMRELQNQFQVIIGSEESREDARTSQAEEVKEQIILLNEMITLLIDENKEAQRVRVTQQKMIASQQEKLDTLQSQVDISREETRSGVSAESKAEMNDLVARVILLENIIAEMDMSKSRSASGAGSAAGDFESDRGPPAAAPKPGVLKAPPYELTPAPAMPPPVPKAKAKASEDVAPEPKRSRQDVVFKPVPGTSPPRNPPQGAKTSEHSDQEKGHQRMPANDKIDMSWRTTKQFNERFTPRSEHSAYHPHDQRIMAGFTPVCYPDQCPKGWRERKMIGQRETIML